MKPRSVFNSVPAVDRRTRIFLLYPVPIYQLYPSTEMSCGENAAQEDSSVCVPLMSQVGCEGP